jgi:outer membrane protein TolC
MAVVMHLQIISEGIRDMAQRIIELNFLDQRADCQDKVIECRREKVKFLQERYKAGVAPQMEVQIADQELAVSQAETEWIAAKRTTIMDGLYPFFGLYRPQRLDLNLQAARHQILGDFDPEKFGLEQAKTHSFELKIQDIKKRLQEYRISIAYANFIPSLTFGVKQTSPLEKPQEEDYYVKLGFQINLWNGFKDVNDVSRQKMVLRQFKSEMNNKEAEFSTEWEIARRELRKSETAMKLARSTEKLASLKKRQCEIFFHSNSQTLSKLLDSRVDLLDTRKVSLLKNQDYDLRALQIRHLSGDLFNSYVDVDHLEELSNE